MQEVVGLILKSVKAAQNSSRISCGPSWWPWCRQCEFSKARMGDFKRLSEMPVHLVRLYE